MPQAAGKHSNLTTARTEARGGLKREESLRERESVIGLLTIYRHDVLVWTEPWRALKTGWARPLQCAGGGEGDAHQMVHSGMIKSLCWVPAVPLSRMLINCFQIIILEGGMN